MSDRAPQRSSTVDHALSILLLFLRHDAVTLNELVAEVGISKTAAFRIASTLRDRGFVKKDENRRYRLGSVFMQLSRRSHETRDVVSVARPIMRQVMEKTQEATYLSVRSGPDKYLLLDGFESPQRIRWSGALGDEDTVFAGSCGKVHLAFDTDARILKLLKFHQLRAYSPGTITDPEQLLQELRRIRKQGYAISYGERYADAVGVSAPIFGSGDQVAAVLSVFLPMVRVKRVQELVELVVVAVQRISELIREEAV